MNNRLDVLKTYKLYIDGKFPRSESGRSLVVADAAGRVAGHICRASLLAATLEADAVKALTWARSRSVGLVLAGNAAKLLAARKPSVRLAPLLAALRGHRQVEAERVLVAAATGPNPAVRRVALSRFNLSLGQGLGKVTDKVFRIGHLGDFNDLTLLGTLAGVEMSLDLAGVPVKSGVPAAMAYLAATATPASA